MVETYTERTQSRPQFQQDLRVNPSPAAFGAAYGQALEGLGRVLQDTAGAVDFKERLNAENEAREAQTAFMRETQQLRFDPQTGYLTQTGSHAMGEARVTFNDALAAARDRHRAGLSPRARAVYDKATDSHMLSVQESAIRHDAAQTREFTFATGQAAADAYLNEAALNYDNPTLFEQNVGAAMRELDRVNLLAGLPAEAAEVSRRKLASGALTMAISRTASSTAPGSATRAWDMLAANKDRMNADDVARLEQALRPAMIQQRAAADADAALRVPASNNYAAAATPATPQPAAPGTVPAASETAHSPDSVVRQRVDRNVDALMLPSTRGVVQYANQGATRSQPLTPTLETSVAAAVAAVYGPGATARVYSGGQPGKGGGARVGSTRHDHGHAADVHIYDAQGRQITGDGLAPLAQYWLATRQGGAGLEMRGGGIHLDEHRGRAPTWNYAAEGGRYTAAQRAAVEAGLRGEYPGELTTAHLMRTFGDVTGAALRDAPAGMLMTEILGTEAARNLGVAGLSVGQYKRQVQMAYGDPRAPQGGQGPNYAAAYEQADAMMATDPERGLAMMNMIKNRQTAMELARNTRQQDSFDTLWQRGVQTGDWNLTTDERMGLGSALSAAFDTAATNVLRGVQQTDQKLFADLQDMAQADPAAFSQLELADFLGTARLSNADYGVLRDLQRRINAVDDPRLKALELAKANNGVDPGELMRDVAPIYRNAMGYDPTTGGPSGANSDDRKAEAATFRRMLADAVVAAQSAKGSALTPMERDAIAYSLLQQRPDPNEGWWRRNVFPSRTIPSFKLDGAAVLPDATGAPRALNPTEVPAGLAAAVQRVMGLTGDAARNPEVAQTVNDMFAAAEGYPPEVTLEDALTALRPSTIETEQGDSYTFEDAEGEVHTLSEAELVALWARARHNTALETMKRLGLTPAQLRSIRALDDR